MGGSLSSYLFRVRAKLIIVNSMAPKAPSPPAPLARIILGSPRWALILWEAGGPISGNFFSGTSFTVPDIFRKKIYENFFRTQTPHVTQNPRRKTYPPLTPFCEKSPKWPYLGPGVDFFEIFFHQSIFLIISYALITIFFQKRNVFGRKTKFKKIYGWTPQLCHRWDLNPRPYFVKNLQNGHISG